MKKTTDILKTILFLIAGITFLGFFISTTSMMPDNALVLVDDNKNVYYAPPYIEEVIDKNPEYINVNELKLTSRMAAITLAYDPDPECRDSGYFQQDGRCMTLQFLEKIGLLSPESSRWNKDGSWNW